MGLSIQGFSANAILIGGAEANNNAVQGCFIGTSTPNGTGILLSGTTGNTIGGAGPAQRNVMSGNTAEGIRINSSPFSQTTSNDIVGNYIGTNAAGTAILANAVGIRI